MSNTSNDSTLEEKIRAKYSRRIQGAMKKFEIAGDTEIKTQPDGDNPHLTVVEIFIREVGNRHSFRFLVDAHNLPDELRGKQYHASGSLVGTATLTKKEE